MSEVLCTACGTLGQEDARFCAGCGRPSPSAHSGRPAAEGAGAGALCSLDRVALGKRADRVALVPGVAVTICTVDGVVHSGIVRQVEARGGSLVRVSLARIEAIEFGTSVSGQSTEVIPDFVRVMTLDVELGADRGRAWLVDDNLCLSRLSRWSLASRAGRRLTRVAWALGYVGLVVLIARALWLALTLSLSATERILGVSVLAPLLYGLVLVTRESLLALWGECREKWLPLAKLVSVGVRRPVR